jgi:hypothetical protein
MPNMPNSFQQLARLAPSNAIFRMALLKCVSGNILQIGCNQEGNASIEKKVPAEEEVGKVIGSIDKSNYWPEKHVEISNPYIGDGVKEELTEDIKINNNMKEEIINKKFMDIYREFLIKNKLTENPKVSVMLEKIIDEEQKKVSKEKKEIKIHEIEFENLLTYGSNNKINFDKLEGINILAGINGLGKSSLIDIILSI